MASTGVAHTAEISLLGRFVVAIDGVAVPEAAWRRRGSAALVQVLALARGHALHREELMDRLWPDLSLGEATPRLHKAAHFARRALGGADRLAVRAEVVTLLPEAEVVVDVETFLAAAEAALAPGGGPAAAEDALGHYGGELLPASPYEPWTEALRGRLGLLHLRLLRRAGRWEELVALDPTDEPAYVGLMRAMADQGDVPAALAVFDELGQVLERELGAAPGPEAVELRDRLARAPRVPEPPHAGPVQVVRFCPAGGGAVLAYATSGEGPPLVKAANWLSHLEYDWESIVWRHWLEALSADHRLVRYDERGCGLSTWDAPEVGVDAWVRDLATVVDTLGLDRFPLLGVSQGAAVAVAYAARHPERVSRLVLYGGYVHGARRRARSELERRAADLRPTLAELGWGTDDEAFRQVFAARFMPDGTREQWAAFNELQRRTTSPENAAAFLRAFGDIDVEAEAAQVRAPTLVLHARDDRGPPLDQGQRLAALVSDSRFVSLESSNHLLLEGEPAWSRFLDEVRRFLAADQARGPGPTRPGRRPGPAPRGWAREASGRRPPRAGPRRRR